MRVLWSVYFVGVSVCSQIVADRYTHAGRIDLPHAACAFGATDLPRQHHSQMTFAAYRFAVGAHADVLGHLCHQTQPAARTAVCHSAQAHAIFSERVLMVRPAAQRQERARTLEAQHELMTCRHKPPTNAVHPENNP